MPTPTSSDYYARLGVQRGASDDVLRKAYRKLAMKWHPDRNSSAEAKSKFQNISQAYEVLSDPEKRKVYDAFGEAGLQGGAPPGAGASGRTGAGMGGGGMGRAFSQRDAEAIFRRMFGGGNGFGSGAGSGFSFEDAFGSGDFIAPGGNGGVKMHRTGARPVKRELPVTLEQLASGFTKRMKITRRVQDPASQGIETQVQVVTVSGRPGWKAGTKVTFAGAGDQLGGRPAQDVQFVITEKPHPRFRRDKSNPDTLVVTVRVRLVDALCGASVQVPTIEGKTLHLKVPRVAPGDTRIVSGAGMPRKDGTRGDLRVEFQVDFPARALTDTDRAQLRALLG